MTEIDVSGCEGYKDKHCRYETSIMFTEGNLCSKFPNCYYKQLKRLEQRLIAAEQTEQEATEIVAEFKAENAKLKEKLEKIKEAINKCMEFRVCGKCKLYKECDKILKIIEGAEDE